MSESTKALNSQVSTLKKNPGRIGRLVKAAKLLVVPSHQYAGKAKKLVDEAIKKLKAKRGLNGVTGEGAGPFSDKAMKKVHDAQGHKKEAMEQKTKDRALAASAVGSGAALGGVLTHDAKKSRIASRVATKGAYKHMGDSSVAGAEKRLARTSKVMTRMGKPLRRAGVKGAIVGGLAGAALGAAHLKKEAEARAFDPTKFKAHDFDHKPFRKTVRNSTKKVAAKGRIGKGLAVAGAALGAASYAAVKANGVRGAHLKKEAAAKPAVIPKQEFLGKGKIPAGAKDVSPKAVLKRKAGKVALGVAAGAALAGVAKKHMEKKAANKKEGQSNIPGMALAGGGLAYARRGAKDAATMSRGLSKQMDHIKKKGGHITQMDVKMAVDTFKKPMARRALKAAGKGVAVGALAGAALDKLNKRGLKKKAAELIHHKGEDIRRGTIGSAAKKMAVGAGLAGAAGGAMVAGPAGALAGGLYGALQGGLLGGGYGMVRSAFRAQDKERSMSPTEFDKLKAKKAK